MPLNRREFLTAGGAFAALAALPRALAQWQPSPRYPDWRVKAIDASFGKYVQGTAKIEQLATGLRWAEGPVWIGEGHYLLWSDIPNNRIMRWDEATGAVSVYRQPSDYANGNTRDREGRLLSCQQGTRSVTRTEHDGTITVIADKFDGKPLNSPNDIVCKSDGSIWFTDPTFGISGFYEGHKAVPELPTNVYRWDPKSGQLAVVAGDIKRPNGLAFSPDESILYIIESGAKPNVIHAYELAEGGTALANGRIFLTAEEHGTPDGMRIDVDGNLWCGWGMGDDALDGVKIYNPGGVRIGAIVLPERCANLCFGGTYRNRLFMASSTSLYSLFVNTQGAAGG